MSFQPRDYLRHILVEVEYLLAQSKGLSFERFAADETLRRALCAAWKLSANRLCLLSLRLGEGSP